jgi:hypothetical protein
MRNDVPIAHFRPVRNARAHCLGDHAHRQALELGQNVAPEVHAIERSVIAPRNQGFALLRGRSGTAALHLGRPRRIVARCAHADDSPSRRPSVAGELTSVGPVLMYRFPSGACWISSYRRSSADRPFIQNGFRSTQEA